MSGFDSIQSALSGVSTVVGGIGQTVNALSGLTSGSSASSSNSRNVQVLRGRDVLNSNLGTAYITLDGRQRRIFELQDISAVIEQVKEEVMLNNDVMCKHKVVATKGTGTFTIYTGVPDYSQMIRRFINEHKGVYFTISFEMNDPESNRGIRHVTLYDVLIDSHMLGRLSIENGILNEEMGMTFDEYSIETDFKAT